MISYIFIGFAGACLVAVLLGELAPDSTVSRLLNSLVTRQPRSIAQLERHDCLSVDELALVEKYVPNLRSVVILCHRVDEPNTELAKALFDNFQQGAAYTFFVSPDRAHDTDLAKYHEWFEHIFHAARLAAPAQGENSKIKDKSFSDVFSINRLPLSWSNVPYVFYTFAGDKGELATICYKGTEAGVGISDYYDRVSRTEARAIIDLSSAASAAFCPAIGEAETDLSEPLPDTTIYDATQLFGGARR